jgi:hypothetical protein
VTRRWKRTSKNSVNPVSSLTPRVWSTTTSHEQSKAPIRLGRLADRCTASPGPLTWLGLRLRGHEIGPGRRFTIAPSRPGDRRRPPAPPCPPPGPSAARRRCGSRDGTRNRRSAQLGSRSGRRKMWRSSAQAADGKVACASALSARSSSVNSRRWRPPAVQLRPALTRPSRRQLGARASRTSRRPRRGSSMSRARSTRPTCAEARQGPA